MRYFALYILSFFILLACEKKATNAEKVPAVLAKNTVAEEAVQEFVSTSPFEIKDSRGNTIIELSNEKYVYVYGSKRATLNSEGDLVSPDGEKIAKLNKGNILVDKHQTPLIKLKEDGTVDYGSGIVLHWTKDGSFMHGNESLNCSIQPLKIESLKTASMLYYYFLFRK